MQFETLKIYELKGKRIRMLTYIPSKHIINFLMIKHIISAQINNQ